MIRLQSFEFRFLKVPHEDLYMFIPLIHPYVTTIITFPNQDMSERNKKSITVEVSWRLLLLSQLAFFARHWTVCFNKFHWLFQDLIFKLFRSAVVVPKSANIRVLVSTFCNKQKRKQFQLLRNGLRDCHAVEVNFVPFVLVTHWLAVITWCKIRI